MSYIEDVQCLVKKSSTTYLDLLEILLGLEREHHELKFKIKMGLSNDIKTLWKIAKLADRIKVKIEKKLNE
jgi:hypothetical protein